MSLTKMRFLIKDHKVVSWNLLYKQGSWFGRKELADEIHALVKYTVNRDVLPFKKRVKIYIKATKKSRPVDPDNICAKLYVDGLKNEGIIEDDSPKFVKSVTTESVKGKEDEVMISITAV